jgi:hypothetical protein
MIVTRNVIIRHRFASLPVFDHGSVMINLAWGAHKFGRLCIIRCIRIETRAVRGREKWQGRNRLATHLCAVRGVRNIRMVMNRVRRSCARVHRCSGACQRDYRNECASKTNRTTVGHFCFSVDETSWCEIAFCRQRPRGGRKIVQIPNPNDGWGPIYNAWTSGRNRALGVHGSGNRTNSGMAERDLGISSIAFVRFRAHLVDSSFVWRRRRTDPVTRFSTRSLIVTTRLLTFENLEAN